MMMGKIKEFDNKYNEIQRDLEWFLGLMAYAYNLTWNTPIHDIATHIIYSIEEFKPLEEEKP